ncbi:MAG: hypothetical protein QXU81_10185, partial [Candidatus Bathyarchaeia archaeon]
ILDWVGSIIIKNDDHEAWNNSGNASNRSSLICPAILEYAGSIIIKNDSHEAWYNSGNASDDSSLICPAILDWVGSIIIKNDKHEAWNNSGNASNRSSLICPAILEYAGSIIIKNDKHEAWYNLFMGLSKLSLEAFMKVLEEIAVLYPRKLDEELILGPIIRGTASLASMLLKDKEAEGLSTIISDQANRLPNSRAKLSLELLACLIEDATISKDKEPTKPLKNQHVKKAKEALNNLDISKALEEILKGLEENPAELLNELYNALLINTAEYINLFIIRRHLPS